MKALTGGCFCLPPSWGQACYQQHLACPRGSLLFYELYPRQVSPSRKE